MKTEAVEKSFDVMKWLRATRRRIYEETKDMSFEEERRWSEDRIRRDPFLAELYDRRTAPSGGRVPTETASGRARPSVPQESATNED